MFAGGFAPPNVDSLRLFDDDAGALEFDCESVAFAPAQGWEKGLGASR